MTRRKMTKAEAGKLGWLALKAKLMEQGGKRALSAEMARRGARGLAVYAERHHGGCIERAVFALARAEKMEAFPEVRRHWKEMRTGQVRACLCADVDASQSRCPRCGGMPVVPF